MLRRSGGFGPPLELASRGEACMSVSSILTTPVRYSPMEDSPLVQAPVPSLHSSLSAVAVSSAVPWMPQGPRGLCTPESRQIPSMSEVAPCVFPESRQIASMSELAPNVPSETPQNASVLEGELHPCTRGSRGTHEAGIDDAELTRTPYTRAVGADLLACKYTEDATVQRAREWLKGRGIRLDKSSRRGSPCLTATPDHRSSPSASSCVSKYLMSSVEKCPATPPTRTPLSEQLAGLSGQGALRSERCTPLDELVTPQSECRAPSRDPCSDQWFEAPMDLPATQKGGSQDARRSQDVSETSLFGVSEHVALAGTFTRTEHIGPSDETYSLSRTSLSTVAFGRDANAAANGQPTIPLVFEQDTCGSFACASWTELVGASCASRSTSVGSSAGQHACSSYLVASGHGGADARHTSSLHTPARRPRHPLALTPTPERASRVVRQLEAADDRLRARARSAGHALPGPSSAVRRAQRRATECSRRKAEEQAVSPMQAVQADLFRRRDARLRRFLERQGRPEGRCKAEDISLSLADTFAEAACEAEGETQRCHDQPTADLTLLEAEAMALEEYCTPSPPPRPCPPPAA